MQCIGCHMAVLRKFSKIAIKKLKLYKTKQNKMRYNKWLNI